MVRREKKTSHIGAVIGRNLRRLRDERGVSQYQLAEQSRISRVNIAQLELGQIASPKIDTLQALADSLDVELSDLLLVRELDRKPMQPLVDRFLASPWADAAKPTDEEIGWLRTLPDIEWLGAEPNEETVYHLLTTYRRARGLL